MYEFKDLDYVEAIQFLMPRHYSGRRPNVVRAYGGQTSSTLQQTSNKRF